MLDRMVVRKMAVDIRTCMASVSGKTLFYKLQEERGKAEEAQRP